MRKLTLTLAAAMLAAVGAIAIDAGLLCLFAFMHLSGRYHIIEPQTQP